MATKMNFYTQNGWAGKNYDSNLSTKEIAAKVREFARKNFPGFKFSITSKWSMYADSLYIALKAGPCVPFADGSKFAERGYFQAASDVKAREKDGLTPEAFAALDGVASYAASFRYSDSDGMIDYFDTNFYLKIEIPDDYKVTGPRPGKKYARSRPGKTGKAPISGAYGGSRSTNARRTGNCAPAWRKRCQRARKTP